MSDGVLARLDVILETRRRDADPSSSYVAQLHSKGLNKILEKVGEECVETIIAAKDCGTENDQSALVSETADLWFHCMVMLSHLGLSSSDVLAELETRFDLSGLVEKASRSSKP